MFSQFIVLCFSSFLVLASFSHCTSQHSNATQEKVNSASKAEPIIVGAAQLKSYLHILEDKKIGLVVNNTSLVDRTHLLDTLLLSGIDVVKIFAPEHGFRGDAENGEH